MTKDRITLMYESENDETSVETSTALEGAALTTSVVLHWVVNWMRGQGYSESSIYEALNDELFDARENLILNANKLKEIQDER